MLKDDDVEEEEEEDGMRLLKQEESHPGGLSRNLFSYFLYHELMTIVKECRFARAFPSDKDALSREDAAADSADRY